MPQSREDTYQLMNNVNVPSISNPISREPSQPSLPDISNKNYAISSAPMNKKGSTYDEEKLLLEQDAFLLEEQRYLDRLK